MQQMSELLPRIAWPYFHPSGFPSLIICETGTCPGLWSHVHSHSQVTVWSMPSPKGLKSASCSWQASCPNASLSDSAPSGKTCHCYVSVSPFPSLPVSQTCSPHHAEFPLDFSRNAPPTFMGLVYIHPHALSRQENSMGFREVNET